MKFAELQQLKANGWKIVEPKVRAGLRRWHLSPVTSPSFLLPKHICAQTAAAGLSPAAAFSKHLKNRAGKNPKAKEAPAAVSRMARWAFLGSAARKGPGRVSARARGITLRTPSRLCRQTKGRAALLRGAGRARGRLAVASASPPAAAPRTELHVSHAPPAVPKPTGDACSPEVLAPVPALKPPVICAGGEEGASPDTKEAATLQGAPGEGALLRLGGPAAAGGPQAAPGSQTSCFFPPELGHRKRGQH